MKKIFFISVCFLVSFSLVGCNNEKEMTHKKTPIEATKVSSEVVYESEELYESGIYNGRVDSTSIEITVNNITSVFRISDEVSSTVNDLKDGSDIGFSYMQNKDGQLVLLSIGSFVQKEDVKIEKATWEFVGLIDSHSVEFSFGKQNIVAQFSSLFKNSFQSLEKGDKVIAHFYKTKEGTVILNKVEKVK